MKFFSTVVSLFACKLARLFTKLAQLFTAKSPTLALAILVLCIATFAPSAQAEKNHSDDLPALNASKVNINAATPATLAAELKGIGPSKAAAIVSYREIHGAFATVDELVNVKGIGEKTVEKLRSKVIAGPYKKPEAGESLAEQEAAARAAVQSVVKRSLEIRRAASAQP